MRTTVRVDPQLLTAAKQLAMETGRTLTALIEDALRQVLMRRHARRKQTKIHLTTFRGRGVQPGVDLDSNTALLEIMESGHDPDRH